MEREKLRECSTPFPNMAAEDVSLGQQQQQLASSASSLVQDMMETIMEFEEVDEKNIFCTPDSKCSKLASPVVDSSYEILNSDVSLESPLPSSFPFPPTNTPSTGHKHHGIHQQLAGIHAATKLASVSCRPHHQGLQLLRDSLDGLCKDENLICEEDVLHMAATFIKFCRKKEGKTLDEAFKAKNI